MGLTPKEPDHEKGRQARQQYLNLARAVIGEPSIDYETLYQRFAQNDWAAVKLDDAVALKGLNSGLSPKAVVAILHQSPYLQHQVHQNKVPLAPMSQYVRSTVLKLVREIEKVQSQRQEQSVQRKPSIELE